MVKNTERLLDVLVNIKEPKKYAPAKKQITVKQNILTRMEVEKHPVVEDAVENPVENLVENHANLVEREENPVEREKEVVEDAVN